MSYYISKTLQTTFDDAVSRVSEELKKEGFGVLMEIDVKETLKKKLNVDFRKYRILGACNPQYALKALEAEDKIGTMMPCNVIVQEIAGVGVEIAAIDPVASLQAVKNSNIEEIARQVRDTLRNVIERL
jgi:uncharacterized protein (DUF302 family)